MEDEFALCWNNFQDNIATGFQNLYDRGDLVDVTICVDGKLLHAHKIVLAICSPYFQEMFNSNPCKHPIIILKDVAFGVMCELLQFMYQGVVNVKHAELQTFMKIAQMLQVKGLASNVSNSTSSAIQKSPSQVQNSNINANVPASGSSSSTNHPNVNVRNTMANSTSSQNNSTTSDNSNHNINEAKLGPLLGPAGSVSSSSSFSQSKSPSEIQNASGIGPGLKRLNEYSTDSLSIYSRKYHRRNTDSSDHDLNSDSMDHMNPEDVFLPPIPHISMVESRFDLTNVKRESTEHPSSPGGIRGPLAPPFSFDYNAYAAKQMEYPNELHMPSDYSKASFANHMDIPPSGSNITMLSSTSLLHGNCVFNRNNTVATQQGMKTYWLCKAYRITMCRARCITHQGRVISATGVHNHPPHMKNGPGGNDLAPQQMSNPAMVTSSSNLPQNLLSQATNPNSVVRMPTNSSLGSHTIVVSQSQQQPQSMHQQHHHHISQQLPSSVGTQSSHQQLHSNSGSLLPIHLQHPPQNTVIQNMMHNVNLMHMSNMGPIMNSLTSQHSPQINHNQTSSLQITPILNSSPGLNSPSSRSNPSHSGQLDSPSLNQPSSVGPLESPANLSNECNEGPATMTDVHAVPIIVNAARSPMDNTTNCPSVSQDSGSQQSHIIDSITISSNSSHNFKIEDM